jgi:hypothetical protein
MVLKIKIVPNILFFHDDDDTIKTRINGEEEDRKTKKDR